jgi:subtilisin family serine protease
MALTPSLAREPVDIVGHGTHVAGIIGAVGNNGVGLAGVAWRLQLMDCKFLNQLGQEQVRFRRDHLHRLRASKGAHIINASWGGYSFNSAGLFDAINSARSSGIIVVTATGNDGSDNNDTPLYPANYNLDNIVAVTATTRSDQLASWSNYGSTSVDLGAPGIDILSCWNGADNDYQFFFGTSMATPHVTGACALVWARYPGSTYRQVIQRVLNSVDPLPALAGKCLTGGRLNLQNALGAVRLRISRSANPIVITIIADPNTAYLLEASTTLNSWSVVASGQTGANGESTIADNNASGFEQRFFRASGATVTRPAPWRGLWTTVAEGSATPSWHPQVRCLDARSWRKVRPHPDPLQGARVARL